MSFEICHYQKSAQLNMNMNENWLYMVHRTLTVLIHTNTKIPLMQFERVRVIRKWQGSALTGQL